MVGKMDGKMAGKLPAKMDSFEIERKIFHLVLGIILAILINYGILKLWMVFLIVAIGIILSITSARRDLPIVSVFLDTFERREHRRSFPGRGVIFLFVALAIIMSLFEKGIVLASLMVWCFGDSVSALVGKHYGRHVHPLNERRLIEGTIAGIAAGTIAAAFFVSIYAALFASVVAMSVESLEISLMKRPIDDNLLVPVVAAAMMWLIYMLF